MRTIGRAALAALAALAAVAAQAVQWRNVDIDHHLGGRKASEGYLQGKVVLVYVWDASDPASAGALPRVEELWQSFKSKPFVVIGSHRGDGADGEAQKAIAAAKTTFPMYLGAGLAENAPLYDRLPFAYVVDESGRFVYRGADEHTVAQAIVTALTDLETPRSAAQFRRFLDFELENLPGRAYLRMRDFRKRFPAEAVAYEERYERLCAIKDVKSLAELVKVAREVKDAQAPGRKQGMKKARLQWTIDQAVRKYSGLKESGHPLVVREAKNALADLAWAKASL